MSRTRLQMANEVLDNLSRSSTGTTRSGATLGDTAVVWLNRAQVEIARKRDFLYKTSTAATVADTEEYAFPSNVRSVYSFILEDGTESLDLIPVMPWEFDKFVPKPSVHTTGRPSWYVPLHLTNTFKLFRIPDSAYTLRIRHTVWPTALSADASISDYQSFGIDLDDAIVALATSYGFRWLQELVDERTWRARAFEMVKAAYTAERNSFPHWQPIGRGFTPFSYNSIGDFTNNPFVREDPASRASMTGDGSWL